MEIRTKELKKFKLGLKAERIIADKILPQIPKKMRGYRPYDILPRILARKPTPETLKEIIKTLPMVPKKERVHFFYQIVPWIMDYKPRPAWKVIRQIFPNIPMKDHDEFFGNGLPETLKYNPSVYTWKKIVLMLPETPEEHRYNLFKYGLPEMLKQKTKAGELKQKWKNVTGILSTMPEEYHRDFFRQSLAHIIGINPTPENTSEMIKTAKSYLKGHEDDYFFNRVVAENYGRLTKPRGVISSADMLSFYKESSKLIPLGGGLNSIIRVIRKEAFKAWKEAFEDEYLKNHVEPILEKNGSLRAYASKDGLYRVYTKYCGIPFLEFTKQHPEHLEELENQKDKIIKRLNELRINHMHAQRNFVVDENDGKPVVKLIDFDAAVQHSEQPNSL